MILFSSLIGGLLIGGNICYRVGIVPHSGETHA